MALLNRIAEDTIQESHLYGQNANNIENEIKRLIDIIFGEDSCDVDYSFFDIRGTVLLHGVPGTGKTTIMNNCMYYALENYGTDCYELVPSEIIESALGKANSNLVEAIHKFEDKDKGILFIDELDRLCINRQSNELDELKRMLIELMQFFDRIGFSKKKMVISCTNVFSQIDDALIRRMAICEEMKEPDEHELIEFANVCREKAAIKGKIIGLKQKMSTFDDVKRCFRNILLIKKDVNYYFELEDE